ncbi:hypothetical protein C8N25_108181 [Algoriphagus antarcticus]|uniref:Uncharacterized protein n=1 Tax=Algoriphagus antarcticus TaxID=238540 RepID=A0A3E0DW79_9BACT|nr:hypothetical protein C8N25_108181 [Algoriphagus antarcticus]
MKSGKTLNVTQWDDYLSGEILPNQVRNRQYEL